MLPTNHQDFMVPQHYHGSSEGLLLQPFPHGLDGYQPASSLAWGSLTPPPQREATCPVTSQGRHSSGNRGGRVPRKHGYTRQRRGCQTCRQRKKKCNQSYPVCGHCSRLNLECSWEGPRTITITPSATASSPTVACTARLKASQSVSATQLDHLQTSGTSLLNVDHLGDPFAFLPPGAAASRRCPVNVDDLLLSRRAMMRYYTQSFAIMLTTNTENNCFLSVLLPMAFESPALTYSLAAFSSAHLALRHDAFARISLQHRGQALAELNECMGRGAITEEMSLAVTMVLCSMASISDATDSWAHHLSGAAAILQAHGEAGAAEPDLCRSLSKSYEGRWLLRNFAYHDILASVSLDRRPLLSGDFWIHPDAESVADTYFGFAAQILLLVSEISTMNADLAEACEVRDDAGARQAFMQRASSIERQLREWECPTGASSIQEPLLLLGEAYRQAAMIHLYRVIRRHLEPTSTSIPLKMSQSVAAIRKITASIPHASLVGCTILFPLFMAGGEADDADDIKAIRESLLAINQWRRFRNFDECLSVLDHVWRLNLAGTRKGDANKVDWVDVVKLRGWKLAIT